MWLDSIVSRLPDPVVVLPLVAVPDGYQVARECTREYTCPLLIAAFPMCCEASKLHSNVSDPDQQLLRTGCDHLSLGPACKDMDPQCAGWAASGECGKNPNYMVGEQVSGAQSGSCRKSCRVC
jgi:hypothetical protein